MAKKAQVISFYDIFALIVLLLGSVIWMFILRSEGTSRDYAISNRVQNLNQGDTFINILRTDIGGEQLSDLLLEAYSKEGPSLVEQKIDVLLQEIYGAEVCWVMTIDDENFINMFCLVEDDFLDATAYLPYPNTDSLKVQLTIMGYKP